MAKRAKAKRPKQGVSKSTFRAVRTMMRGFDRTAEFLSKHASKEREIRRAGNEWTKNGERLPHRPPKWQNVSHHTAKDKEIWRATFMPGGLIFEFTTWPVDYAAALVEAKKQAIKQHGIFAESWECVHAEYLGLASAPEAAVENEENEDITA